MDCHSTRLSTKQLPYYYNYLAPDGSEIRKLANATRDKGTTLIPLKAYFVRGMVKVLLGVARGKRRSDKREDLAKREARRDIDRAMSKRL